jgi:predicted transcriptional regulator
MLKGIDRFWTNYAKHVINMPRSIPEMIRGDFKCEDIAKCILGIKEIDIDTYKTLVAKGPMTAESLGVILNRERSTAYRSLQNLMGCGLVRRETRTISSGGYFYEYLALDPVRMKEMVQGNIDQWYNKMKKLVTDIDKDIMK